MGVDEQPQRLILLRRELAARINDGGCENGAIEVAENIFFAKFSAPNQPFHGVFQPSLCVIAQGAKEVLLGDEKLRYDADTYLLGSLNVPVISQVCEATAEVPYLSFRLKLDPAVIASVSIETGYVPPKLEGSVKTMSTSAMNIELLDAVVRLARMTRDPVEFEALSPLVIREIVFRLLRSEHGSRLRQMATFGGQSNRVGQAIQTLSLNFKEQISIDDLARSLSMSASSFHEHFKAVTSMSPLQFQKQIRLQEARRLLLGGDIDSGVVAMQVGYLDSSQFIREYKRMFGNPPQKDARWMRESAAMGQSEEQLTRVAK